MNLKRYIGDRLVIASISGGKDSAAMSLHLTELGIPHMRVFADTGWEADETYEYIRGPLTAKLGPIHTVRGPRTFEQLVLHKRIFPDRTKRFCTDELKVAPILKFIEGQREGTGRDIVNAIGVRRAESAARAASLEWEDSAKLDVEVWRPIVTWTVQDVIDIHKRHDLAPNPLYARGVSRVGCWPCIYANQREIITVADTDPARIDRLRELEREATERARVHHAANGKPLDWIRSMFSIREGKKTHGPDGQFRRRHLPMHIDDAIAWARRGVARNEPDGPATSCGEWGFCE